jgi:hypothetical protein
MINTIVDRAIMVIDITIMVIDITIMVAADRQIAKRVRTLWLLRPLILLAKSKIGTIHMRQVLENLACQRAGPQEYDFASSIKGLKSQESLATFAPPSRSYSVG